MVKVFLSQVCDVGNKGDQAILKSEVSFLKSVFPGVDVCVSTLWSHELVKKIESGVTVHSSLVDLRFHNRDVPSVLFPAVFVIQVFLSTLSALLARYGLPAFYRSEIMNDIKAADLVLSSGHQPFNEGSFHSKTLWSKLGSLFVLFWGVMDVFIAKKVFNKPFVTFPQSVGPFNTFWGKLFSRFIFKNVDVLNLREDVSAGFINGYSVKKVQILRDMAFLFEVRSGAFEHQYRRPLLGVSPCFYLGITMDEKENYIRVSAKALDYLQERFGFKVVFLPSQTTMGKSMMMEKVQDDLAACQMIMQSMVHREGIEILDSSSVEEFCGVLAQLDLLVSTRMHPTILASKVAVPFVEVTYEYKQTGLLKILGLSDVSIPAAGLSFEGLVGKTEYVWKEKDRIRKHLSEVVPVIADETRRALEGCLQGIV
jgi:polysaccharide pyruvyl transferase WcaK-like protein